MTNEEKVFELSGSFLEKKKAKKFTRKISANNEAHAKEKLYAFFGSKNKALRRQINIENIKEVKE